MTIRGHRKWQLIKHLAEGTRTVTDLADEFEVTPSAICYFRDRNGSAIQAQRDGLVESYEGLWIADRTARLNVLEGHVEYTEKLLDGMTKKDASNAVGLLKIQQAALEAAARETGQLINRAEETIKYEVTGVDPTTLT